MFQINNTEPKDLKSIAQCQMKCFPNSHNTKLGQQFISKSLQWFLQKENRFLFHITDQNQVIGFCGGFSPQFYGDGSSSGMLQFAFKEAIFGIAKKPWLLFNKSIRLYYPFILRNIKKKLKLTQTIAVVPQPTNYVFKQTVGLVVIGVHPNFRGKGVFEKLMIEFENRAKQLQIKDCILSVRTENLRAIAAYKKMGWFVKDENEISLTLTKTINL